MPPCHGTAKGTRAARHVSVRLLVGAGAELGVQEWVLPGCLGGTWMGMCRDSHQGCAPARHHCHGLKESPLGSYSRGSCLAPAVQLALPSAAPFPARQIQETSSAEICLALSPVRSFF